MKHALGFRRNLDVGENLAMFEFAEARSVSAECTSINQMAKLTKVDFAVGIGGENGQGIASTGDILARIFARRGLHLNAYNAYQSIIRGGHTFLTIRASDAPVRNMGDKIDVFIPLNQDTMDRHLRLLKAGACAIFDNEKIKPGQAADGVQLCPMPMKDLTKGNKLAVNTAALGAALQLLGIESEPLEAVVARQFKKKGDAVVAENIADRPGRLRICGAEFQGVPVEGAGWRKAAGRHHRQPGHRDGRRGGGREILCGLSDEPIDRGADVDGAARAAARHHGPSG